MVGIILVLLVFLLPLLLLLSQPPEPDSSAAVSPSPMPVSPLPQAETGRDRGVPLRLLQPDGTVENLTLEDYLRGVLAAEMPASFHAEALKAQAVAARTYFLYQRVNAGGKHANADLCTDPGCCQAYLTQEQAAAGWGSDAPRYLEKLAQAVADTDGLVCLYDGQPIDAVFFASAAGRTSDAQAVWGGSVPYLVSVASPEGEEVPNWRSEVTFTPEEFTSKVHAVYPDAQLTGPASQWLTGLTTDNSGAVSSLMVGGVTLTGPQVRSLLGLRSAHFVPTTTDTALTFQVTGHGHGVGMSQYGANALAAEGKSFQEILCWYYTGITVAPMP